MMTLGGGVLRGGRVTLPGLVVVLTTHHGAGRQANRGSQIRGRTMTEDGRATHDFPMSGLNVAIVPVSRSKKGSVSWNSGARAERVGAGAAIEGPKSGCGEGLSRPAQYCVSSWRIGRMDSDKM